MAETLALGEICLRITKGTTPTISDGGFVNSGVNYIKSECLSYDGTVAADKFVFISPHTHERLSRSKIQERDILYSIAGANLGKCGIAKPEMLPANTNQAVAIIRVDPEKGSPEFVSYVLRSSAFVQSVFGGVAQSAQPNVNLADIGRFQIPNWPISTQLRIAEVLSALDDKIELNRRMNETLEGMAQAIFRDWFVDFGPTRRKAAGEADPVAIMGGLTPDPARAAELAALFPAAFDDDDLPVGWTLQPVSAFAHLRGGKQLEKQHILPAGPNPVFGGAGIMGYATISNADGYVITVGRVGAYCGQFFGHRGAAWVNNNASLIKPLDGTPPEWLLLALRESDIESIKRGAAQPFVSNGDVSNLPLVDAGAGVRAAFEELIRPLFLLSESRQSESATLAETRDFLLPRLMSGAVRVEALNTDEGH